MLKKIILVLLFTNILPSTTSFANSKFSYYFTNNALSGSNAFEGSLDIQIYNYYDPIRWIPKDKLDPEINKITTYLDKDAQIYVEAHHKKAIRTSLKHYHIQDKTVWSGLLNSNQHLICRLANATNKQIECATQ